MMRMGWFLTGLVAVAWLVRAIAYGPEIGDVGFVFITFCAAIVVILIWLGVLFVSGLEAATRLRREMRAEGRSERPEA